MTRPLRRADGIASRAASLDTPEQNRELAAFTLAGPDGRCIAAGDGAIDPDEAEHRGAGT